MKLKKLFFVACNLFGVLSFAQVGINTTTPNAALDVTSTDDGLLIPRVALTASNVASPLTLPTISELVYNTATAGISPNNVTPGFYYWDGAKWVRLQTGASTNNSWLTTGNTGTNASTNFLGTIDNIDLVFKRNNTPSGLLNDSRTSFGYNSLNPASTGSGLVAMGVSSLRANTTGSYLTAIGNDALNKNTTGSQNTAIGTAAMHNNTTGEYNFALGNDALKGNTSGRFNIGIGVAALTSNTIGERNIAIGNDALKNSTDKSYNIGIGESALKNNTVGEYNIAVGSNTMENNSGSRNNVLGIFSLSNNTSGSYNTAIGYEVLYSNTTGNSNFAGGYRSLFSNTTGSNNTGLGYNSQTGANLTNATAIGANASATTSNSLVLGSINGVNGATASANVGIGTTAPNAALEVKAVNPASPTNTEGLLIPRINVFPATNPTAAQHGMQVFLTTAVGTQQPGFYYWDNPTTSWVGIGGSASGNNWALAGNTVDANHFLGTTNWMSLKLKAANTLLGVFEPNGSVFLGSGATGNQNHSFTIGLNANASASESVSIGTEANSDGYRSQAIGYRARSTAFQSVAIGPNALASAASAIAIGDGSRSTQNQSMALGASASVTGNRSTALGYLAVAEDDGSLALGYNSTSKGNGSLAIGRESSTNAQYSTAIGYKATTSQNNAIVLGDASDPLSKIGIGTSAPTEKLHVVGNIRIVDGNEAAGRVLTSDANGKATWASSVKDFSEAFNNSDVDFPWYSPIAFQNQGLNKNVTFSGGNLQTILAGTYKVTYSVSIRLLSTASVDSFSSNFHLRLNGAPELPNTKCYFTVFKGATTSVSFSKLITVPAYTTVQLWSDIGTNDIKILGGANIRIELLE